MWYEWESIEDFDAWHLALCDELGYPLVPKNQESGKADKTAQKVLDYTSPIEVSGKIIATVEEEYASELTATDLRPPQLVW
jgi:hypothetical protein